MKKRIFSLLLALCLVAGMLPTVAYAYNNSGTIDSGEFIEDIDNRGTINGGTFNGAVTNYSTGVIYRGVFNRTVNNIGGGHIHNGTFNSTVNNASSTIHGGTFHGAVTNDDGHISGGIFYGEVTNNGRIESGTFYGTVSGSGTIKDSAKVTVTFDSDNGNAVQEEKVLKGQKVSVPTEPTKEDCTFVGWYNGDTEFDFANTPVTEDIILTAKWSASRIELTQKTIENYRISSSLGDYYSLPSGHYYLGEDISVNISVDIRDRFNDADVTLDLNGHTLTNSCTDSPAIFVDGNHSLTLMDSSAGETGRFTGAGKEVIGIYVNGGSFVMAGGTVDGFILDVFICEGGTFTMTGGTLKGTADGGALYVAGKSGSNYTDKAIMYADGGTVDGDAKFQNCTVEKSPSAASETVFNGKVTIMGGGDKMVTIRCGVFCGTVENGGEITGGIFYGGLTHIVDSDGKLGENAHAITFMDGVTQYAIEVLDSGVASYAPDAPTQTGCSFDGWYNGDTEYTFGSPITEGLTLNAHWTFNPYTITLDANGGTVELSTLTTGDGWKLTGDLPTPTRDGYTFAGWFTKAEGGTAVTNETVFDKDTTICAHWIVNQYTITFETDGGSEIAPIIQDYGTDVTAPGNPTKPGYTFAGWEPEIPDTMPAEDMTITAKWTKNSSGGSSTPTYAPTVTQPENGTVTVSPKSPRKGVTVTITPTPDAGYTVEQVLVTDKNGDAVEVINNGDGTYSFTQPAGKVNVTVTFMEDNSMLNFFVDVFPGDYYYDAVLWAAENGITGGVDDIHFAPNAPCTRAQIVTFLWRAAGCPEPESLTSLSDVPADAYYAKAVAWALENGITTGTGDGTTFSPNATCTRAQAMTFIYRSEQARGGGMQGAWMFQNPFSDVDLESYYGESVMWAVANGVTDGTTDTTFSPGADCTRAQIVTFLYRCFVK